MQDVWKELSIQEEHDKAYSIRMWQGAPIPVSLLPASNETQEQCSDTHKEQASRYVELNPNRRFGLMYS
jgi:hypothetical protein